MKRFLSIFGFALISLQSFGGEVEDVLKKMQANFSDASNLEYTSTYELFKGHKSTTVEQSYEGYLYRSTNQVYQKINETEFVYGKDFFLKISHSEKAMQLDLAQKSIQQEVDMTEILKNCSEKTLVPGDTYYTVVLKYKNASSPFGVVKIRIEKTTYKLQQLDLYYTTLQDFSDDYKHPEMVQPHLRIKIKGLNVNPVEKKELFMYSKYIAKKNNMLSTTGRCAGYELIDNRLNNKL